MLYFIIFKYQFLNKYKISIYFVYPAFATEFIIDIDIDVDIELVE